MPTNLTRREQAVIVQFYGMAREFERHGARTVSASFVAGIEYGLLLALNLSEQQSREALAALHHAFSLETGHPIEVFEHFNLSMRDVFAPAVVKALEG